MAAAQATASQVDAELKDLKTLLVDIETARPVDQLTVRDKKKFKRLKHIGGRLYSSVSRD